MMMVDVPQRIIIALRSTVCRVHRALHYPTDRALLFSQHHTRDYAHALVLLQSSRFCPFVLNLKIRARRWRMTKMTEHIHIVEE
jgi:hypothetical protein